MAEIGDLCETKGEITMEWRIKEFSSLHQEVDKHYESPKFYFCGASWNIWLFPNGETHAESNGWLSLYVVRRSSGSPVTLDYSFCVKSIDGKNDVLISSTADFHEKLSGWGGNTILLKTVLMEKKSELLPSGILIVVCSLKNKERNDVARSLFSRHQELSDNLKEIFEKEIRTDCILKVDGTKIAAHRMILETRSPVFAAMFKHDTKENETGEISIVDIDEDTMEDILEYVYSGDIDELEMEQDLSVYAAAEKYDIKNVKEMCTEFIIRNLSVDCVCDVIKFNGLYQEKKIDCRVREYFKENVRKILKTDKWATFAKENPDISIQLLSSALTAFAPE